jgi:hypothetical protein
MKIKLLLPFAAFAVLAFTSCKKDNNTTDESEIETTFELSANEGIAENLTQDANEILNEAAYDNNLQGSGFVAGTGQTNSILACATVTVTPASGFPKNVVIDFGTTGCTSPNGITRRGIINVNITDSLRRPGSIATMTFNNYYVGGFKKEGTITWTNTSTTGIKSWRRVCVGGKITAANGTFWLHEGTQNIVQTAGTNTPNILIDDVFSITGNRTVTNAAGRVRVGTIITALQKKTACDNIDQGIYQIQGPNHVAVINYGDGTCDNRATISIDGRPARTFILR